MKRLRGNGQAFTFVEPLPYFNEEDGKNWCKQALSTYLLRLKTRNYVTAEKDESKTLYSATITRVHYNQLCAKEILDETYHGMLGNFIAALTGRETLTSEEQQHLIQYITDYKEENL